MKNFNFFKVLEKDDKELIHSAFISFLFDFDEDFRENFLGLERTYFDNSELEVTYRAERKKSKKKKKSDRKIKKPLVAKIDIQAKSTDRKSIVLIENKFKSFPDLDQIEKYNKVFKHNKDLNGLHLNKFLFCFDKNIIDFKKSDWVFFDYSDFLKYLEKRYVSQIKGDQYILIHHYKQFLKEYVEEYKGLQDNCSSLFTSPLSKINKFWLNLIYSQILIELQKEFDSDFEYEISARSTTPILNIKPLQWKARVNEKESLNIQIQKNILKLYLYLNNKDTQNLNRIIGVCNLLQYQLQDFEINNKPKSNSKSNYILRIDITHLMANNFSIKNLCEFISNFYRKIDNDVIPKI